MTIYQIAVLIYLAAISLVSVIVCCYDKIAAKRLPKHRTRESTLLLLSALGGSVAMLLTMLVIRHKTKHIKFMVGIPLIILLQAAATVAYFLFIRSSLL
ncbi:MAG: DUF1294 domain-containing protein [Eubacteriales bacterium]